MAALLAFLLAALASAIPHGPSSSSVKTSTPTQLQPQCTASPNGALPSQTPVDFHFSDNVRTYFIAAEETEWDYAPSGWDNWLSVPMHLSPRAKAAGYFDTPLGTKWTKAVYRQYTDASFSEKSDRPPWQGIQGPTIRAEVGDMVEIMFANKLPTHYASMHSMGLAYSKENEGAVYQFRNETVKSDAVPPGGCVVYKWLVPESAAPNNGEPATMHGYHSYVSMREDMNAGLIGPQFTYARGKMVETKKRYREFPVLLHGSDESTSFYAAENARRAGKNVSVDYQSTFSELIQHGNQSVWRPQLTNLMSSTKYSDAPNFLSVNGLVFGNLPTFEMCLNDEVIWYVYGQGDDPHTLHLHGNGFNHNGNRKTSISVIPGTMETLYMNAAGAGDWQLICHINEHVSKGMVTYYRIIDGDCTNTELY